MTPRVGALQQTQKRDGLIICTLALTGTVVALQQTLVLPLLPELPDLLSTSADNASWLVTATLLFGAVSIPTVTRLADMFGKKRMLLITLALMVAGSVLGAVSSNLPLVLAGRALQGIGISMIPVGIALMRDELPSRRVPLGVALMSASLATGAGAGLPLSGLIASHLDWHAIFWVTGVVGAVLLIAVWKVVTESAVRTHGTFDYHGAIVGSAALTALMLALSKGGHWGWTSVPILTLAIGGIVLLAVWVPIEFRAQNPVVNVRIATRSTIMMVNLASLLLGFAMFVNMLVTTLILQSPAESGYGFGYDALRTGLLMAPIAAVFGVMAPVSASLIRRYGPQMTLFVGSSIMALAYGARVYLSNELWQIMTGSLLVAGGTSLTFAALPTLIMRAVPITETASANGLNTLLRSIGTTTASAAVAAITTVGSDIEEKSFPQYSSFVVIFWVCAGVCVTASFIALGTIKVTKIPVSKFDHLTPQRARSKW